MIVTVTLNAAIDRTLTVPNFQLGQRHRASQGLTLAGGKGINVARALKRLDVPVVATGLAGGRTGTRIVEELTSEAILNDFVRIADESRTSTAVVDPTAATYTEINEWGPHVEPEELAILLDKISYLARGADMVVFAGTLPRGVDDAFYAEAIRDLNRRNVPAVLDSEGPPLRSGVEAEAFLVTPNQREAEGLVGQELGDDEDYTMALDRIADMGARNVLITAETRSFGLFRAEPEANAVSRRRAAGGAGLRGRLGRRPPRGLPRCAGRGEVARGLAEDRRGRGGGLDARGRSRALRAAGGLAAAELGPRAGARAGRRLMSWRGASVTRWESS